jgi:ABC-type multidrug transport system fused ATPase/permease subunit
MESLPRGRWPVHQASSNSLRSLSSARVQPEEPSTFRRVPARKRTIPEFAGVRKTRTRRVREGGGEVAVNEPINRTVARAPVARQEIGALLAVARQRGRRVHRPGDVGVENSSAFARNSGVKSIKSSSLTPWRSKAGGLVGKGCVGEVYSPGTVDCGAGRSSIGQTGWPVTHTRRPHVPLPQRAADRANDAPRAEIRAAVIIVSDVHKSFARVAVLRGITTEIARGEVVCIIGASGSGKSTLLRCINGLERCDRGEIRVDGRLVDPGAADIHAIRTEVAMVFQRFHLFPHRTVIENVMEGPLYVRKESRTAAEPRAHALLARVGLADKCEVMPATLGRPAAARCHRAR